MTAGRGQPKHDGNSETRNTVTDSRGNTVMTGELSGGVHINQTPGWVWYVLGSMSLVVALLASILVFSWSSDRAANTSPAPTPPPISESLPEPPPDEPRDPPLDEPEDPAPDAEEPGTESTPEGEPVEEAPVGVWWSGTLELGGYGGTGGGWFLDQSPPGRAVTGDLYFGATNEIGGTTLVAWDSDVEPEHGQCAEQMNTHLGRRWVPVQVGSMACFATSGGRVGYFTVTSLSPPDALSQFTSITVTVWELT